MWSATAKVPAPIPMTAFRPPTCTGGLARDGVHIRVAPSDGDLTNGGIRATHSIQLASTLAAGTPVACAAPSSYRKVEWDGCFSDSRELG
jgi:hypothetical protein